ncbi:hypothetical protein N6H14_25270 [Paenibacillus sp. CC-CFT747]|nr:hypothetical protein N6H14_25270 [Paenibacillus sp. CC-CFT747]
MFWNKFAQVGDAALLLPPLCGDGMSVALRSALLCAGLADRFLAGESTVEDWQTRYTDAMSSQIRRPLRWGNRLHAASERPLLTAVLFRLAGVSPWLASSLLKATRLKDFADG